MHEIGFPYSFAYFESGAIGWISGSVLKEGNLTLFELGSPTIQARKTLEWDGRSPLCSPDGRLEILVAWGNRGIVEAIALKQVLADEIAANDCKWSTTTVEHWSHEGTLGVNP